jgi:hypothetical protein
VRLLIRNKERSESREAGSPFYVLSAILLYISPCTHQINKSLVSNRLRMWGSLLTCVGLVVAESSHPLIGHAGQVDDGPTGESPTGNESAIETTQRLLNCWKSWNESQPESIPIQLRMKPMQHPSLPIQLGAHPRVLKPACNCTWIKPMQQWMGTLHCLLLLYSQSYVYYAE